MRAPKPEHRFAEHRTYGRGLIKSVRELDSGGGIFVADVKFEDVTRTIRLAPEFWNGSIAALLPKNALQTSKPSCRRVSRTDQNAKAGAE